MEYCAGLMTVLRTYIVMCGLCEDEEEIGTFTKRRAEKMARGFGWSKTVAKGWICPSCAARRQRAEEE